MKAIILAAGKGERLKPFTEKKPKGLLKLLGLSLLERNILMLHQMGIKDVGIVVGYKGGEIIHSLSSAKLPAQISLSFFTNPDWEKGNGTSLLCAQKFVENEEFFLVLMADHVFDSKGVKEFLENSLKERGVSHLWVDTSLNPGIDIEDATKVQLEGDLVKEIGKGIEKFEGVDCGMFFFTPEIFPALKKAFENREFSLTSGVRRLVRKKLLKAEIIDAFWQDIDTPSDLKWAKKKLLLSLRNPKDGWVSKYLNRPISLSLTSLLAQTSLTPNQVSLTSFALGLLSALFFFFQKSLAAAIFCQLSSIIDGIDGEIARAKFEQSQFGSILDSILDRYADAAIICGLTFLSYVQKPSPLPLILGALALTGAPLSMLFKEKFKNIFKKEYLPQQEDRWANFLFANRDGRLFVIFLFSLFNFPLIGLTIISINSHLLTLARLCYLKRKAE